MDQIANANARYSDLRKWSTLVKARDVMTSPVVSIESGSSVLQAVRIMLQRHISGLPVVDKRRGALWAS